MTTKSEITGKNKLLESDRDLRSSVNLRNKTIIPLGFLQVSLLRRLRDQTRQPPISEFLEDRIESKRAYSRSELLSFAIEIIFGSFIRFCIAVIVTLGIVFS